MVPAHLAKVRILRITEAMGESSETSDIM